MDKNQIRETLKDIFSPWRLQEENHRFRLFDSVRPFHLFIIYKPSKSISADARERARVMAQFVADAPQIITELLDEIEDRNNIP